MKSWTEEYTSLSKVPNADEAAFFSKLATKIVYFRIQCGFTLATLSVRSGISESSIGNIETGLRRPTITTLYKLAVALDVPIRSFFE